MILYFKRMPERRWDPFLSNRFIFIGEGCLEIYRNRKYFGYHETRFIPTKFWHLQVYPQPNVFRPYRFVLSINLFHWKLVAYYFSSHSYFNYPGVCN